MPDHLFGLKMAAGSGLGTRLVAVGIDVGKPGLETPSRDPHSGFINFRTAIHANLVTTSGLATRGIAGVQVAIP